MTDRDVLAALDRDVPDLRPAFRSQVLALLDDAGTPDAAAPTSSGSATGSGGDETDPATVVDLVDARAGAQRRRRWLAPAAAAAAVAALVGTWALVTSPSETEPTSPSPTVPADPVPVTTTDATNASLPLPTAVPGCPPVPVVAVAGDDGVRATMTLVSYGITFPPSCRQPQYEAATDATFSSAGVVVTSASSLAVTGTPDDARVQYGTYVGLRSGEEPQILAEGTLTDDGTGSFGSETPGTQAAPDTGSVERPIVREIPLADEPCITVVVRWSTADENGMAVAHVARTPDGCDVGG